MEISHVLTWISQKPVGQTWSNFMRGIIGVEESFIKFLGRLYQNSGFHGNGPPQLIYNKENDAYIFSRLFFIRSFIYF